MTLFSATILTIYIESRDMMNNALVQLSKTFYLWDMA